MNHCGKCNEDYSEDFKFCPADGAALRPVTTGEGQPCASASADCGVRSQIHIGKWFWIALAVAIALGAVLVFTSSRGVQRRNQASSQPAVVDQRQSNARPAARRAPVSRHRTRSADDAQDDAPESRNETDGLVQQARAQQLVATGYRRMQQRDYQGAEDAFDQALDIDPDNSVAQKGLKAAQMAESVEGVAGVFQR